MTDYIRKWLPKRLQNRLLLMVMTPMILMQAVALWVFFDRNWDTMTKKLSAALVQDIDYAIHLLNTTPPTNQEAVMAYFAHSHALTITWRENETIANPHSNSDFFWGYKRFLARDIGRIIARPFRIDDDATNDDLHILLSLPTGVLHVSFDKGLLYSSTTLLFVVFTFLTMILLGIAVFSLARNQARPITHLAHAMDEFGKGKEIPPPPIAGSEEIRRAIRAFALMRGRIHQQMTEREHMITAISHDLNTAISRIKLNLALKDDSDRVKHIQQDINDIESIIEDYVTFLRSKETEKKQKVLIADLWKEAQQQFSHHTITHDEGTHAMTIRPKQFKRCLFNIVDNATHYSKKIHLHSKKTASHIELIIDDDGIGISKKERAKVFHPFYRLEPSRNRATGGLGLGMSIARDIMRAHKGDIQLDSSPQGGLRVRLIVPV